MSDSIRDMFTRVAPRYDLTNHVLSFGLHLWWKKRAAERSGAGPGDAVLDCATGTGDLAFLFAQLVRGSGTVVGCDFNERMLELARDKEQDRTLPTEIDWELGDVQDLDHPDDSFDVAAIAFGLRNVDDPDRALGEMARVVRPGGRVVVLEFGQPTGPMAPIFELYSGSILPRIGSLLTGEREAYEYLHESASDFPCGDVFVDKMRDAAPFDRVQSESLTAGVAWLYLGSVGNRGPSC